MCRIDRGIGIEMHVESAHASDRCRSDSAGFCNETNDVTRDELAYLLLLLPGEVVESSNASLDPFGNLYGGGGGGDREGRRGDPLCCPPPLSPRPAGSPWKSPLTPPHPRSLLLLLLQFLLLLLPTQRLHFAAAGVSGQQQQQQTRSPVSSCSSPGGGLGSSCLPASLTCCFSPDSGANSDPTRYQLHQGLRSRHPQRAIGNWAGARINSWAGNISWRETLSGGSAGFVCSWRVCQGSSTRKHLSKVSPACLKPPFTSAA